MSTNVRGDSSDDADDVAVAVEMKEITMSQGKETKVHYDHNQFRKFRQAVSGPTPRHLKYMSLFLLALQNAALILVMRYVRTRPGAMFASSTAVVMSELLKVGACLLVIWFQEGGTFRSWYAHLNENIFQQPRDCVRISVPAFVYMIQNNLIYVAASNLDAATFQVTYQLKILTTAILSVVMLRKQLTRLQWVALLLLFIGVAAVNIQANSPSVGIAKKAIDHASQVVAVTVKPKAIVAQSPVIGFVAVVTACILSGFAGVYFEKILKSTPQSIYVRNVQLGVIGSILGVIAVYASDGAKVTAHGFFYGYDMAVWSVIMLHAFGGIVVAVVVKYADNILKGFAASAAIIISCVVSIYLFDFELSALFLFGTSLVIISTYMYSRFVPVTPSSSSPSVAPKKGNFSDDIAPEVKII